MRCRSRETLPLRIRVSPSFWLCKERKGGDAALPRSAQAHETKRGLPGVRSKQKRIGIGVRPEKPALINDINSVVLVLTEALKYTDKMRICAFRIVNNLESHFQ